MSVARCQSAFPLLRGRTRICFGGEMASQSFENFQFDTRIFFEIPVPSEPLLRLPRKQ